MTMAIITEISKNYKFKFIVNFFFQYEILIIRNIEKNPEINIKVCLLVLRLLIINFHFDYLLTGKKDK